MHKIFTFFFIMLQFPGEISCYFRTITLINLVKSTFISFAHQFDQLFIALLFIFHTKYLHATYSRVHLPVDTCLTILRFVKSNPLPLLFYLNYLQQYSYCEQKTRRASNCPTTASF